MCRTWMAAAVSLSMGAGLSIAAPSFGPSTAPHAEQVGAVRQPDLAAIVRSSTRGGGRPLPVMFWLGGGSASSASRDAAFTHVDPLSEGDLRDSQVVASGSPFPLGEEVDAPPLILPAGSLYHFRDAAPRAGDPANGPFLIPLPPAIGTGLVTLGAAIAVAVRHRLRRR